jgi:uncharacterized membrane protein
MVSNKKNKKYKSISKNKLTKGQKIADKVTLFAGSWTFIFLFIGFLIIWMILNGLVLVLEWDPYPFILLNLILSCIAALQAPVILMSQNRAAQRDRIKAERDYYINRKSEREIEDIQSDLEIIKKLIKDIKK